MFKPINIYPANISILSPNPIKIYILHTKEKKIVSLLYVKIIFHSSQFITQSIIKLNKILFLLKICVLFIIDKNETLMGGGHCPWHTQTMSCIA